MYELLGEITPIKDFDDVVQVYHDDVEEKYLLKMKIEGTDDIGAEIVLNNNEMEKWVKKMEKISTGN